MSRSRTRARRRRAHLEDSTVEFDRARANPKALSDLLDRLSASDAPIWPVAEAASRLRPLDDAERAMVAQAVAPQLAGMTSGLVRRRLIHGKPSPVSSITTSG